MQSELFNNSRRNDFYWSKVIHYFSHIQSNFIQRTHLNIRSSIIGSKCSLSVDRSLMAYEQKSGC